MRWLPNRSCSFFGTDSPHNMLLEHAASGTGKLSTQIAIRQIAKENTSMIKALRNLVAACRGSAAIVPVEDPGKARFDRATTPEKRSSRRNPRRSPPTHPRSTAVQFASGRKLQNLRAPARSTAAVRALPVAPGAIPSCWCVVLCCASAGPCGSAAGVLLLRCPVLCSCNVPASLSLCFARPRYFL